MKKSFFRRSAALLLSLYTFLSGVGVSALAKSAAIDGAEEAEAFTLSEADEEYGEQGAASPAISEDVRVGSRILELILGKRGGAPRELTVGGDVFGVRLKQKYVTVTESRGIPALRAGDIILSVGGKEVDSCSDVREIVSASGGESLTVRALHGGNEIKIEVRPQLTDGEYRIGLTLRDGAVGIGTVTFIDPETGLFGGLGHGVCDGESGEVIDMESGEATGVILGGIHRGECGKPGELSGILTDKRLGELTVNSECGVFGILKKGAYKSAEDGEGKSGLNENGESNTLPIASRDEVHEGAATIVSTLKNGKKAEYTIEIFDVDRSSCGSKSFRIRATDKSLRALTGGIVRGMSGSPIIQDGKLVGAVTHVLINDPTTGYGIFIENMLNAAQIPLAKAS